MTERPHEAHADQAASELAGGDTATELEGVEALMALASEEEVSQPGNRRSQWWIAGALAAVTVIAVTIGVTALANSAVTSLTPEREPCFLGVAAACDGITPERLTEEIEQTASILLPAGATLRDSYSQSRATANSPSFRQVAVFELPANESVSLGLRFAEVPADRVSTRLKMAAEAAGIAKLGEVHAFRTTEPATEPDRPKRGASSTNGDPDSADIAALSTTVSALEGSEESGARLALILVDQR